MTLINEMLLLISTNNCHLPYIFVKQNEIGKVHRRPDQSEHTAVAKKPFACLFLLVIVDYEPRMIAQKHLKSRSQSAK